MSVFSPSTWLSRSRCQSSTSSADFSKDDTSALRGLTYLSQHSPSLEPSLEQPPSFQNPNPQSHHNNSHLDNYGHKMCPADLMNDDHGASHDYPHVRPDTRPHSQRRIMNPPLQLDDIGHGLPHLPPQELSPGSQRRWDHPKNDKVNRNLAEKLDELNDDADVGEFHEEVGQDTFRKDVDYMPEPEIHTETIRRMSSFGNGSCISGLSADETQYNDTDDSKTIKSIDSFRSRTFRQMHNTPKRVVHRQQHSRRISQGRDFGDVFDHIVEAEDLLTDDHPESHPCNEEIPTVGVAADSVSQIYGQIHGHERKSNRNVFLLDANARPRPLHNRAHSESMAFRPVQMQTSNPQHQRIPSCSMNISKTSEKTSLPVHATLRDVIATKRKQNKFVPLSGKPQILQVRSTSLTVQSNGSTSSLTQNLSTSNTSIPVPVPNNGIPVVWSGQQLDNYNFGASSPARMAHNRSRTLGHVHISSLHDLSQQSHSSEHSNGYVPDVPRSHKSTGSAATFFTQSETAGSNSHQSQYRLGGHVRNISDSESSLNLPLDSSSTSYVSKMEDATTVFSGGSKHSRKSSASRTPRRKGKVALKDELKFVFGRIVPSPLKKVGRGQNKVQLERSAGCLT